MQQRVHVLLGCLLISLIDMAVQASSTPIVRASNQEVVRKFFMGQSGQSYRLQMDQDICPQAEQLAQRIFGNKEVAVVDDVLTVILDLAQASSELERERNNIASANEWERAHLTWIESIRQNDTYCSWLKS